jgi:hypothetical protein
VTQIQVYLREGRQWSRPLSSNVHLSEGSVYAHLLALLVHCTYAYAPFCVPRRSGHVHRWVNIVRAICLLRGVAVGKNELAATRQTPLSFFLSPAIHVC